MAEWIDTTGMLVKDDRTDAYGLATIEDALLRHGVRLVATRAEADAVILPRAGMLSTFERGTLVGLPSLPIPLAPGREVRQGAWVYRLAEQAGLWVLQSRRGEAWHDLYAFTLEPHHPVDYEAANHYVSTHPDSRFVQTLTAQRSTPQARFTIRNREFSISGSEEEQSRTIADQEELLGVLAGHFGLNFPPGTRFRPAVGSLGWD